MWSSTASAAAAKELAVAAKECWTCAVCTLINQPLKMVCECCCHPRVRSENREFIDLTASDIHESLNYSALPPVRGEVIDLISDSEEEGEVEIVSGGHLTARKRAHSSLLESVGLEVGGADSSRCLNPNLMDRVQKRSRSSMESSEKWIDSKECNSLGVLKQIQNCSSNFMDIKGYETPNRMPLDLYRHQKVALEFMVKCEYNPHLKGGLLADTMGLGKTIETISLILHDLEDPRKNSSFYKRKLTLVVCPASVIAQWKSEILRCSMPSLNVVIYHGSCRRLAQQSIRDVDVMITSYGVVASEFKKNSRNVSFLGSLSFYRIILDEAHVIRNAQSSQSKACRYAALKSEFCWCLTGTPIQNSLGDLWPIIDFLKLKPYANCQTSWKMFCGQNSEKNQFQKLKAFLNSFMLRRTHTDIELQLPECLEKIVEEKLSTTELSFYKEMEHHAKKQVSKILEKAQANQTHISNFSNILVLLLRLRQVCNHRNLLEGRFYRSGMTSKNFNVLEFKNRPNLFKEISKESIWKRLLELSISEVVEKECSICMNLIENIDSASILKCCGQFSCTECVLNCLRASRSCPFCRSLQYSPLKAIDLFRFQESVLASSSEELASSTSQITPSTKLSMLFVTLKSIMEEFLEDKIIIFSQFQGFLDIVQSELRRHQLAMLRFDGSMSIGERDSVINEFTKNPSVKILLMSLKCGNMGVNIVAANHIILLDPWWNPMIRRQAVARCHRIGQNKPVYIYRMMIKDTVEERLFEVEKSKEFLFDSLMNDSPCRGNAQRLDVGEIRMLFGV